MCGRQVMAAFMSPATTKTAGRRRRLAMLRGEPNLLDGPWCRCYGAYTGFTTSPVISSADRCEP